MVDYNKEFFGENSDSEDEKVNSQNVDYGVGDYNSRFDEVNDYIEPIEEEEKPKPKKRRRRRRSKGEILLFDYVLPIVVGLVISFLLIHFFGRGVVKGNSMSPTLKDGQNVIIFKSNKHIKRNDIVFLHSDKLEEDIVKRVIAVENDVVEIKGTDVYVNSKKIDDSYTENHTDEQYIKPMKIPEGCIYVLGDNRDDSTDSRVLGPVDVEDVFAKVIYK
ncbi:signal peptidase I [Eubacterium sp.]|uniref:signal peptidase I n=1 Tax=Eubacterium sp. TaxID=142586 RepID=UPI0025E3735E|nr:signal peptidase I [Eubacterium sp.]MCR5628577.1 signal peptidase I [Eubacterium sp.]